MKSCAALERSNDLGIEVSDDHGSHVASSCMYCMLKASPISQSGEGVIPEIQPGNLLV